MRQSSKIRSTLIFMIFLSLYLVLVINLYFIQVWQTNFFSALGNRQYHIELTNYPIRGEILDRYGRPVALNRENISAFVLPKQLEDAKKLNRFLKKYFPSSYERLKKSGDKHFIYIARRFPQDLCDQVQCDQITDLKFMQEPSRYYPSEAMGPVVGITNIDNHGMFGLEQVYDATLAGKPTKMFLEKDARHAHYYFKRDLQASGSVGHNLSLTIDSDLQAIAYEALAKSVDKLEAELGCVVIMDAQNGEILSLVSYPGFDPNSTQVIDQAKTRLVPVVDSYEYGSIMKVFVALAALDEGVVQPDELIDCENRAETYIDGMKFTTTKSSVNGEIPFSEVVARSNNIGMVKVAKRLNEKLYDHYVKLGFGSKTGLNFLGEQSGYVSHPAKWSKRSIISLSFGYEISATLLQVARAFALIANGGELVTPKLILEDKKAKVNSNKKIYDSKVVHIVQDILRDTVQHGTGVRAKIRGYDVMGKTGTANLAMDGTYSQNNLIFTFAGIVQKGNYNRVIVTCIKNVKNSYKMYGANTAAPLFEKIAEQMLVHDKVV